MKLSRKFIILAGIVIGIFLVQGCDQGNRFIRTFFPEAAPPPYDSTAAISDTTLAGGTTIYTIKQGEGPFNVRYRDKVKVYLTGRTADGKIFRTSYTKREGFPSTTVLPNLTPYPVQIKFNTYYLIEGLRKGLIGMKEGEKRIIRVPPSQGFTSPDTYKHGVKVSGKTLIYNVKLVQIIQ